jgi:hypothetical protein
MIGLYRRLPEEVRRCLRPLNLLDELASFLPVPLATGTATATEMARRLVRLPAIRHPVRRLEGRTRDGDASLVCVLAADDTSARFWTRTLFSGDPREERLGATSPFDATSMAATFATDADLALSQVVWPLTRAARDVAFVPSSVPLWIDTARPLDAIVHGERAGRSSRKDDVRRVRRLGLGVRIASGTHEVERFRRELYEPYATQRFGDLFLRVPRHAFRHAHRRGWLLFLEHEGRTVAGALLERWGRDVRILAFGVDVDAPVPSGLLLEACYYHSIGFAAARGFRRLSLGTARPVLTDGVLRYKRKWGAAIGRPSTWEAFALHYRNTRGVRAALAAAPLVVSRPRRALAARAGHPASATPNAAAAAIDTPGLRDVALLIDETPVVVAPPDGRLRVVAPGAAWPPEAELPAGAPVAEPLPVRDLLDGSATADMERTARAAHRD